MVSAIQTVISVLFCVAKHHFSAILYRFRLFRHDIPGKERLICIPRTDFSDTFTCKHLFFYLLDDYKKMVDDICINLNFCCLLDACFTLLSAPYPNKNTTTRKYDKSSIV